MLSKNNKILIGCLALLLVMSVGYALFSDTITINGTATAKGEFDITATCQPGILSDFGTAESLEIKRDEGYQNDVCSVVDDTISLSTEFLYPGARRNYTVKLTNTGTIDAVYDESAITDTEELCVADNLKGENKTCITQSNANSLVDYRGYFANMYWRRLGMMDPNGKILTQAEVAEFVLDYENFKLLVKPGYSIFAYFSMFIEHSGHNNVGPGEMFVEYNATYNFPLSQYVQ